MLGNIHEAVHDVWGGYAAGPVTDPTEPGVPWATDPRDGVVSVMRGGSYPDYPNRVRCTGREGGGRLGWGLAFRPVRSVP